MTTVAVNKEKVIGKIKPMHGVGQPPLKGINTGYFFYLSEAHIPYSRLHDVGGWFGGNMWVDIPNIFRDFDADETNPENYDFTWTDILIKGLMEHNCPPVYRLGVTIENFNSIKAYRTVPPKDFEKWARICEHIIRHYNEGWANGFFYDIKYWEIWNEPDNGRPEKKTENMMWTGTAEDFYDLYRVTSKHLRKCFGNTIKIGGYGHSGFYLADSIKDVASFQAGMALKEASTDWELRTQYFLDFFDGFIDMVVKENLPFDFFSHHSYASLENNIKRQTYAEKYLEKVGHSHVEIHLNEWNTTPKNSEKASLQACAHATAMLLVMQNMKMDMMCFYDAQLGIGDYAGLFNPLTYKPFYTFYGFKAFGELYVLENQVECAVKGDSVYALSAYKDGVGKLLVTSNKDTEDEIKISGIKIKEAYTISEDKYLEKTDIQGEIYKIKPYETVLFVY
ncbi:MAG: hypothetical protein J6K61_04005 [Clostridia bacterium]|nr:hypothetical protein [Clostridia bacterium]